MEKEIIKTEEVHKVFVEYFMPDDSGKITVQTRKFTKEDKADFFINTLPERGVKDCSKKVITKISFKDVSGKMLEIWLEKPLKEVSLKLLSSEE